MPDIGLGEIIVIVVIALLVFGPDRLPKVAADAARMLRQVRQMAATARRDLVDAAGLEDDGEMAQTVRDLRDLDPRRAMDGVLTADPTPSGPASTERRAPGTRTPPPPGPGAGVTPTAATGPAPVAGPGVASTGTAPATAPGAPTGAGAQPVAPPVVAPAQADPDWT